MTPRVLVTLQVLLSASLVLTARPTFQHILGLSICLAGVAFGVWAIVTIGTDRVSVMPQVREDAELKTRGPYRIVRHPMYTGLLLACLGLSLCPYAVWKIAVLISLAIVLASKTTIEEQQLRARFPDYEAYAAKTKKFVPYIW